MYQGKYIKTPGKRVNRKPAVLLACLILIFLLAAGGTVALIHMATNPVQNTFTPANVAIEITEDKTDSTKSDIQIKNTSDVPVYVRSTLAVYWQDTINGELVTIAPPAGASVTGGNVQSDWFEIEGIYYYTAKLEPGETTSSMLDTITVTVPDGSTAQCIIDVRAEAIQAEPAAAVQSAWTDVIVDSSGNLTKAGGNGN